MRRSIDSQPARKAMAQQQQQQEHLPQSMLTRTEAEISTTDVEEEARKLMAEKRLEQEHLQQSMLTRSAAEVGIDSPSET